MDIYEKLYKKILYLKSLKTLEEKGDLDNNFIKETIEHIPYPPNLKKLLFEYHDWSLKVLNLYKNITLKYIDENEPLEKLI